MDTIAWLERLVAHNTVSRESNLALIDDVQAFLSSHDIPSSLTHNDEGTKANLHAIIGPEDRPGVMLSGHTDVCRSTDRIGVPIRSRFARVAANCTDAAPPT